MSKISMLDTPDDMRWLRDGHLPKLSKKYKAAVITGNEDCPTRIEAYRRVKPRVSDKPLVFVPVGDSCVFKRKTRGSARAGAEGTSRPTPAPPR